MEEMDQVITSKEEEDTESEFMQIGQSEEEEAIISKFKPIELSCRSRGEEYDLWVFWSKKEGTNLVSTIQKRIRTVLCSFEAYLYDSVLIQFWAPTKSMMMGSTRFLTTSQQPFAFQIINDDLIRYRKNCSIVVADLDGEGNGEGVAGRVFNNQLPEFSQDVSYYSLKEHSHRELALSCSLTQTWAFPVFEPSQKSCVGVLEFLFSENTFSGLSCHAGRVITALKLAGLVTIDSEMIRKQIQEGINHVAEAEDIMVALQQVCQAHQITLACVWARCKDDTSWSHNGISNGGGDFVVSLLELFPYCWMLDPKVHLSLNSLLMRVGQGVIGNAFLSDKPFLCTDLTQLSMIQHPMALFARESAFISCITICLHNIATRTRDYVLEFYLPPHMTYGINFHLLLSSMLATLKHHLKLFEAVVVNPGDKLFVEVDRISINSIFESLEVAPPTIIIENELGVLQNEGEVLQAHFPDHHLDMGELANSGGDSVGVGVGVGVGLEQRGKAIVLENKNLEKKSIVLDEKGLEKKSKIHNQKESSCSYETLKQHFGRKLEDAAESLGVSRSTVKRWCRENNINRWPFPKRSKVTSSQHNLKAINEPIQGNGELILDSGERGCSSSEPPKLVVNTIIVKTTYMNDIIKFQLSFSSSMNELVEKLTLRLKLSEADFTIKYIDDDGDHIRIVCDEDLRLCINSFRILEKKTIKMLIEPLAQAVTR